MAFKATALNTSQAFDRLKTQAVATKNYLTQQRASMVQSTCDAQIPLSVIQHLGQVDAMMTTWAATPGLADYARAQYNDPSYDVVAEFQAMKTAIANAKTSLVNAFPKDANGYVTYQTIQTDGSLKNRTFTSGQLAGAVSLIDAVIATIE